MITPQTKIHDKFTLEFKTSFKPRKELKINNFMLNTWIFVPNSLDINVLSYKREDFYKDLRTNVRLITPVFAPGEIVSESAAPLRNLEKAMNNLAATPTRRNIAEYEYQIKMFSAIFKSAIRDKRAYLLKSENAARKDLLIKELLGDITSVLHNYRKLEYLLESPSVPEPAHNYFLFGDEFMSNFSKMELFRLINSFKTGLADNVHEAVIREIASVLDQEKQYATARNYVQADPKSPHHNSELVFRVGALKKYIESDLFLNASKKPDGVVVEHIYYSIAAGVSMILATAIAFSFQLRYGNFTMPFFVALVVSYMLKDRIKELMRYYFSQKKRVKYYDNKTTISIKDKEFGFSKERFDFIEESKVPREIMRVRNRIPLVEADNRYDREKIMLFRKSIRINRPILEQSTNYDIDGIVEIVRLNLESYMRKMDNPEVPLYTLDENFTIKKTMGIKNYYLNIILQYTPDTEEKFVRYRVGFNRNGINTVTEMQP